MEIKDWITLGVPSVITIIGFIVTYLIAKKNIYAEITKYKKAIMI